MATWNSPFITTHATVTYPLHLFSQYYPFSVMTLEVSAKYATTETSSLEKSQKSCTGNFVNDFSLYTQSKQDEPTNDVKV